MRILFAILLTGLIWGCASWPDLVDVRSTTVKVADMFGHGSGTIISKDMVLTAGHVVRPGEILDLEYYNGTKVKASVYWIDDQADIALLKLEAPAQHMAVIDCKPLEIGERVFTMGNPEIARFVLTEGIVAGTDNLGSQVAFIPAGMPSIVQPMIIISADWEPGDSGAGVFDMRGRLRAVVNGAIKSSGRMTNNGLATPVTILPQCKGKAA